MKTPRNLSIVRSIALVSLFACHSAQAATQYASGSLTWDNASTAAWSATPGGAYSSQWTSGNDAVFEGTAGTVTLATPTARNLTFNTTGYTLSGASTLTLSGTTPTISLGSGITATIGNNTASVLGGTVGLTKSGAGTLTLNGSAVNTFTGTLNLKGGTLNLDFANLATPTNLLNSAVIPNGGGGTLTLKAKTGGGTSSQTLGVPNSDAGYVSKILADPNSGTLALSLGTIETNFLNKAKTGRILMLGKTAGSTGTFSLTTIAGTGGRILYTSDGATAAAGASMDYWGTTGPASYTTLPATGGANSTYYSLSGGFTRTTTGSLGGIKIIPTGASQSLILATGVNQLISVLATGTDAYSITGGNIASADTNGGSQFVVHQYNTGGLTISSVIGGSGGVGGTLFKNGSGTLTLSGANVYGDITWLAEGTLSLATLSNGGNGTQYAINTTTGSAIVTMAGTSTTAGLAVGMALARPNEFVNTSRILSITDSTHFVMDTNATANATGTTTKTLAGVPSNLGMAPAAAANLVIGDATLQFTGTTATSDRAFTIQADKTATFDITGTSLTMAGATGTTTTGGLTKTGAGTLTLTGTNTYSGPTSVSAGTLKLNSPNTSNETSTVTIASTAAALELNFSGTDTVGKLFIGGSQVADGVYEAIGNPGSGIEIAQITGTGTLTVGVVASTYTVTYHGNGSDGGSVPTDSGSYLNGATVSVLTNSGSLTKTGFVFSGWNTLANGLGTNRATSSTFTMGTANVTLYAKWVAATYTVTYNVNGSDGGSVPTDSGAYLNGATVTVLTNSGSLTKTGFVFSGWNTQADGLGTNRATSSTFTMGTANVTLYAKWVAATYTVTYNVNGSDGGSVPTDSGAYLNGATVSVLTNSGSLTKTGYAFSGWNTQADGLGTDLAASSTFAMGTANVTLYAKWIININFSSWAATHAGGGAVNGDFDNDGVSNGVEYFMNITTPGFTANPTLNGSNTVMWSNGGNIPSSAYGTQFVVQISTDLSVWTRVPATGDPNLSNTSSSVSYTLTGTTPLFVRLVVTPN